MPLSAAEKQRRYRMKRDADPDRRARYLATERQKYTTAKVSGKKKSVKELSERDQRKTRKQWRLLQRNCRKRKKEEEKAINNALSPPQSPENNENVPQQARPGRMKKRRDQARCYKRISLLEQKLANEKAKTDKYRKRFQRLKLKHAPPDSPRTKTRKILKNFYVPPDVRKTLHFHNVLTENVSTRLASSKTQEERRSIFRTITAGKLLRKYRMQKLTAETFGFSRKRFPNKRNEHASQILYRMRKANGFGENLKKAVCKFFDRDDVSRMMPGKKDTVTKNKVKKQKRLLCDTLLNLHGKYCSENPTFPISYSLFCSLRPFWVCFPRTGDRDTCQCKNHENLCFITAKLNSLHLVSSKNPEELLKQIVCGDKQIECMYRRCELCKAREYPLLVSYDEGMFVTYMQWETIADENGFNIVTKQETTATLGELVQKFQQHLSKFCKHAYNISRQFTVYRSLRDKLSSQMCMIHIDFAENYVCKFSNEIQAVHFGGSHKQVTMHTGVAYIGQKETQSFCTLSDSRQHDATAIWCYLQPVLRRIKSENPDVRGFHFFSDGPTSQYRQKVNFFLFSQNMAPEGCCTWNFFEASHGKGAPDGVGGALKRSADNLVNHGVDIPDAKTMYDKLQSVSGVKLFYVSNEKVLQAVEQQIYPALTSVPGTMATHQVISDVAGEIWYREVGCVCSLSVYSAKCDCFPLRVFRFPNYQPPTSEPVQQNQPTMPQNDVVAPVLQGLAYESMTEGHIGQSCVVKYDGKAYPGRILSYDETDVEVECMKPAGENRFFWSKAKDICHYEYQDVLGIIPEPRPVTSCARHAQIEQPVWDYLKQNLSDN